MDYSASSSLNLTLKFYFGYLLAGYQFVRDKLSLSAAWGALQTQGYSLLKDFFFSCFCFLPAKPIFSVDIHPDGTKFATGGQGTVAANVSCKLLRPVRKRNLNSNLYRYTLLRHHLFSDCLNLAVAGGKT